jgi:hypothetical protein
MPHFAHKRIESDSGELDFGSPSHSWNDSTGELYQASIGEISSSESSESSGSRFSQSPDNLDKLSYADVDDAQPAMVKKRRKRAARVTDFQFETAAERRSYFSKTEHRRAIQFGREVRSFPVTIHAPL